MKKWIYPSIPFIGIMFFLFGWKMLYSWLGYMLDADAVGYLTMAERVARGEYMQSINGLWSPLNSWLLLIFSHENMNYFYRAQVWNVVFGVVLLVQTWLLMRCLHVQRLTAIIYQLSLSVLLIYPVYYQVFADLLQCVFLLFYLLFILRSGFNNSKLDAVVVGLIIGIGFYAKAYTWVFFLIHFFGIQCLHYYQNGQTLKTALSRYSIAILTSLLVMFPFIWAIHEKYAVWSLTGLAGKLNMSWYINSGKTFKEGISLLIPPPYSDSPSFWEDPYLLQGNLTGPFSSLSAFIHWLVRVVHTCLSAVQCYAELSVFAIALLLWGIYRFLWLQRKHIQFRQEQIIVLALGILPLGYLAMHIETRYLWLSLFLFPILIDRFIRGAKVKYAGLLVGILSASFLVFPLLQIESLREKNKDLFYEAKLLRKHGFEKQRFTGTPADEGRLWVLAYLTKSKCYTIEQDSFEEETLREEMKHYDVPYVFIEKTACHNGFVPTENEHWERAFETKSMWIYKLK